MVADQSDFELWLRGWDPLPAVTVDSMDPGRAVALAAVMDEPAPASPWLLPLWHWVYFVDWPTTGALGTDGHPSGGAFIPPIPERTRMFVGGRLELQGGLRSGVPARRYSSVIRREVKEGTTGTMLFVTVRHEIEQGGRVALVDEQDLMYRSGAAVRPYAVAAPTGPLVSDASWQEPFKAGPVLLFRFSALTANSHRIHYDLPYATGVEGYRDLVVHGPLLAVLLADLVASRAPDRSVASMRYRFLRPVLAGDQILLAGRPDDRGAELAALAADGEMSARASVVYR